MTYPADILGCCVFVIATTTARVKQRRGRDAGMLMMMMIGCQSLVGVTSRYWQVGRRCDAVMVKSGRSNAATGTVAFPEGRRYLVVGLEIDLKRSK